MKTSASMQKGPVTGQEEKLDFGTYHYGTSRESARLRERIKVLFTKAFNDLPFSRDDKLKVLDAGCGLGFLSCVCAEFYPNASVTGLDTFEHSSLKNSSLEKARRNAKVLGFSDRIVFRKGDILRSNFRNGGFDLLVSNLLFHNLGRKRLDAYQRLARWTTPRSCAVLGDLFFDYEADVRSLSGLFSRVKQTSGSGRATESSYKVLVLSEPIRLLPKDNGNRVIP